MSWFGKDKTENDRIKDLELFRQSAQTLESRMEEIRHDHKNSLTTIGEDCDNGIGWGNCDNQIVDIHENTFNFADDGDGFENLERFTQALLLGSKNSKLKQDDLTDVIFKGKFGLGLPKGSIIVCNKVMVISKLKDTGEIYISIANWDAMKGINSFTPKIRLANEEEIEEYNSYFGKGTLIKYENLLQECILDPYKVYNYLICLYKQTSHGEKMPKIHIYKDNVLFNFNDENIQNPIVNFLDTCYSDKDPRYIKYGFLIRLNNGKFELCMKDDMVNYSYKCLNSPNFSIKYPDIDYIIKITINALCSQLIKTSGSGFIKKNNNELIGFKIYRNGRDVTTSKSLRFSSIDPDKKMYRDKGVRISLDFVSNRNNTDLFDNDFKVSSLKSVDESSYFHFNDSLRDCLNKIGSIAENNFEERKKSEKKDCETQLRVMFNYILQNYKKMDGELVETYSKIINTLYDSNKYSSDI